MSIVFTNKINDFNLAYKYTNDINIESLEDFISVINNTKYLVAAYLNDSLIGYARAISEGVETAYIIGAYTDLNYSYLDLKYHLIKKLENELIGKRKMLIASPDEIELYERLGYYRCKNAYTYNNLNLSLYDGYFLPKGYRFEEELYKKPKEKKNVIKKDIIYKNNLDGISFDDINNLLTRAFFNHLHDINKTKEAFNNSQYFEVALDGNKLVGIARAVSDSRYSTILNVAVDPDYQGLSIGRKILLNLSIQLGNQIVFLNTHAGAAGFYNNVSEYIRNKTAFEKGASSFEINELNPMFLPKGYRFIDEY